MFASMLDVTGSTVTCVMPFFPEDGVIVYCEVVGVTVFVSPFSSTMVSIEDGMFAVFFVAGMVAPFVASASYASDTLSFKSSIADCRLISLLSSVD